MPKDLKGRELPKGIYQRKDGRYEARAMIHGNSIQLYNYNLKELKADFEKAKEQARQGINQKYANITLNEWFEEWFTKYKIPQIKETSINPMRSRYYGTFGAIIGNKKVVDILNIDIQEVMNTMHEQGRASSSMRDALGRVRECLESAKNNRIITVNPCFDIVVPWEKKNKPRRFLTKEEQNKFLETAGKGWYKEMFYTMFLTGMRVGEIGGLKWEDIDFKNKCIHIKRSLSCQYYHGEKMLKITTPKTHNSYRKIPFMGEIEEMLLSQREKQQELKKELGNRYRSTDEFAELVFVTSMGSPATRYIVEKECNNIVRAINEEEAYASIMEQRAPVVFEKVYPHAIRHTFCSRCFQFKMNPKVVQALMGHQNYSTTIDIYTHVMENDITEETCKMKSALSVAI